MSPREGLKRQNLPFGQPDFGELVPSMRPGQDEGWLGQLQETELRPVSIGASGLSLLGPVSSTLEIAESLNITGMP